MTKDGKMGADRPCCDTCHKAAKKTGFKSRPKGHPGLNEDGEAGTTEKPCLSCSH